MVHFLKTSVLWVVAISDDQLSPQRLVRHHLFKVGVDVVDPKNPLKKDWKHFWRVLHRREDSKGNQHEFLNHFFIHGQRSESLFDQGELVHQPELFFSSVRNDGTVGDDVIIDGSDVLCWKNVDIKRKVVKKSEDMSNLLLILTMKLSNKYFLVSLSWETSCVALARKSTSKRMTKAIIAMSFEPEMMIFWSRVAILR